MTIAAEIRPGSVEGCDLALIERALARSGSPARLVAVDGTTVEIPHQLVVVLEVVIEQLRAGNGVSVAPLHAELTTVEAAELLNVSRPHLIKLLDRGDLPHRMVGTHRRLKLLDVLTYRDDQDARASEALDEMTRQAEELGLYD